MNSTEQTGLELALPAAAAAIRESSSIVLACHVNPDGDALGSMLGLSIALKQLGKAVVVALSQDGVPDIYKFLPQSANLVSTTTELASFDLAIVLDSGDLARVGDKVLPLLARAKKMINIDHHVSMGPFGDIQVVHSRAASTSEIVYQLLQSLAVNVGLDIATCLFTGVITDTGSFRFQNVTPNTFRVAAELLESGAPPAFISENVFENRTFASTVILGRALASAKQYNDGAVITAQITWADFNDLNATDADTEGIVNYVRGVRGAHVGILLRQMQNGQNRISLRSRETVDVSQIAREFGGGGHRMASGCTIHGELDEAEKQVVDRVLEQLRSK